MLAAIDLGTNSARLLVGTVEHKQVNTFWTARVPTRMGEGLKKEGIIRPEAMERTAKALEEFKQIVTRMSVSKVDVFATSAAREALNAAELVAIVESIFDQKLRVISGKEEARLSYEGAVGALKTISKNSIPVVVDIGGGSVEFCTVLDNSFKAISVELGAVRCTENPVSDEYIEFLLEPAVEMLSRLKEFNLIGVGGTITTLAAIEQSLATYDSRRIHGYVLCQRKVSELFELLSRLSLEQRRHLPGLEPARADIINAGTKILLTTMQKLKSEAITVSEVDLLQGALIRLAGFS